MSDSSDSEGPVQEIVVSHSFLWWLGTYWKHL
jgi:hypothetical protein